LVLIDECDQSYLRDETKEYSAILKAARRFAGATGTPFVLEKGRTVPIFGRGKTFNKPCALVTKADLRDRGFPFYRTGADHALTPVENRAENQDRSFRRF
jgi:hypothetical protein